MANTALPLSCLEGIQNCFAEATPNRNIDGQGQKKPESCRTLASFRVHFTRAVITSPKCDRTMTLSARPLLLALHLYFY